MAKKKPAATKPAQASPAQAAEEKPAARPSKATLARYCELREKKRALESEARQYEKEVNVLGDAIMQYMDDQGKTAAKVHGYQVTIEEGRPYVSWKEHYVMDQGSEAAAFLMAHAPKPPRLNVLAPTA